MRLPIEVFAIADRVAAFRLTSFDPILTAHEILLCQAQARIGDRGTTSSRQSGSG